MRPGWIAPNRTNITGKKLSLYHQRALHVLMAVAADGIAGEGKDAGLVGYKRHIRGLAGMNSIG